MKVAFVINARNKVKYIGQSVLGALGQTYPCEIILSDQSSTDGTYGVMQALIDAYTDQTNQKHTVKLLRCPVEGPYGMRAANDNFDWAWRQSSPDCSWVFQSSADDYSLPDRVSACVKAIEQNDGKMSAVATTMFFAKPGDKEPKSMSGFPKESGYVKAGDGLINLAYGSCIAGYRRDFLEQVSDQAGANTPDVLFGYLAALMDGFYVVAEPHHVHNEVVDSDNTGFQGKLRAATGDMALKVAELNHFQLGAVYQACAEQANRLGLKVKEEDWLPLMNTIIGQAISWTQARKVLHEKGLIPEIMPC